MRTSRPVEVEGRFLGVVVNHAGTDWRFIATDPAVEDIDRTTFPSPTAAERAVRLVVARSSGRGRDAFLRGRQR